MSNATTTLLSLTGAQLRAEPTNAAYAAEIARRAAKREASGKAPVAEVFRRMHESAAPKAPKAVKAEVAPVIAKPLAPIGTPFSRTTEVVPAPKSAIGHLHNRVCNLEAGVLAITSALASQNTLLNEIVARMAK